MKATALPPTAFYESLFDTMLDGLAYCQAIFDAQGKPIDFLYIKANEEFERLMGLKKVEGKKATQVMPGIMASNPELLEAYGRVSLTGKAERFETYLEPLGRSFLVSVYSPKKKFVAAMFQNITVRKEIEKDFESAKIAARNVLEDLQTEKERLAETMAKDEALLESIGEGLIAIDNDRKIMLMNKVAVDMLGWTMTDLIGQLIPDLPLEDESGNPISLDKHPSTIALASGEITKGSYFFIRKDKTRFPMAVTATPIKLNGQTIGLIEVIRDITQEEELDRAKTEFISIASHQLRTPVSGLSWLTEALQFTSENLNPKQKIYVQDLSMLSKRLIELVEDLLNISRIQMKTNLMTEKSLIEFPGFVEEFIKEIEPYAKSKKHIIVFNHGIVDSLALEINKKSLYNVFQNLVSNAIEYSPENTAVTIGLEKNEDFIKISISNKGSVIPKDEQAHLFGRFYRGESTKKMKAEGTGLGLYIIKMIIEEMGGKVGFESEDGKDTMFWFTVPLKSAIGIKTTK